MELARSCKYLNLLSLSCSRPVSQPVWWSCAAGVLVLSLCPRRVSSPVPVTMHRYPLVLCALLSTAFAFEVIGLVENPEKFKNSNGCYIEELDGVIPVGSSVSIPTDNGCYAKFCFKSRYKIQGCPAAGVQPPLKLITDNTKPYPACCQRISL